MILEHYDTVPLVWPPRDYEQEKDHRDLSLFKPRGLWVSVPGDDDWPSWCRSEEFRPEALAVCTQVILKPDANIKEITNEREIITFDREYGEELTLGSLHKFTRHTINWERVASEYDGIIIAPYIWSCRLPMDMLGPRYKVSQWYYPWDCASGCIWNGTKAIEEFRVIEETAVAAIAHAEGIPTSD
jgi:hypothetical protein